MTTDKSTQLYAMVEDYKLELEKQLAETLKQLDELEIEEKRIRAELADLPIRPSKRPKAGKKGARKVKKAKDTRSVFEVVEDMKATQGEGQGDD